MFDTPIADIAAFAHHCSMQEVARHGGTHALSGLGGDELFWSYGWLIDSIRLNSAPPAIPAWLVSLCTHHTTRAGIIRLANSWRFPLLPTLGKWIFTHTSYTPTGVPHYYDLQPPFSFAHTFAPHAYGPAMQGLETNAYTPFTMQHTPETLVPNSIGLLYSLWMAGSGFPLAWDIGRATGVTTHCPFCDKEFMETVMALRQVAPDHFAGQKHRLRQALRSILPAQVIHRPKSGFQPPVFDWMQKIAKEYGHVLATGILHSKGYIQAQAVLRATRTQDQLFYAYKLILLEVWLQQVYGPR